MAHRGYDAEPAIRLIHLCQVYIDDLLKAQREESGFWNTKKGAENPYDGSMNVLQITHHLFNL